MLWTDALMMIRPKYTHFFICLAILMMAGHASAQWQKIAPPIEQFSVNSDGSVAQSAFTLPAGMQYWVHTKGAITASNSGDKVDAHYYIVLPTVSMTGLKVRTSATAEDFLQVLSPAAKNFNNEYFDPIASSGVPLSFRFFDRFERNVNASYYLDNSGSIAIEVAQWTPELILKDDTLDFGIMAPGDSRMLLDSFQAYGKEALTITNIWIQPLQGPNVFSVQSERGTNFRMTETTNELRVTAAPVSRGLSIAALHITSNNAYGNRDRVVLLIARAQGPDVTLLGNDTLDFGVVAAGGTVSRPKAFLNIGDVATSITGVTFSDPTIFAAITPVALPPQVQTNVQFRFTPPVEGDYTGTADVHYAYGVTKRIYLKGRAGKGIPTLSTHFIDFGRVMIGDDSLDGFELGNSGDVEYFLESVEIDNDQFTFAGLDQNVKVGPNALIPYVVRFAPTYHQDPYHEGRMTFKFANGIEEVVILRGRDDAPMSALLKIDTNYYYRPGDVVTVTQKLIADLASTEAPIRKFTEFIQFDKDVLELLRVEPADLVNSGAWVLKTSQVGGAIDIALSSESERLTGPGKLLNFVFRIRDNAQAGTVTRLTQVTPNFYNDTEPLALVEDGIIHVLDVCLPIIVAGNEQDTLSFIEPNSPNPFRRSTEIGYYVGKESHIRIDVQSTLSNVVSTLVNDVRPVGYHKATLDGSSLPHGTYIYSFYVNGSLRKSMKMVHAD